MLKRQISHVTLSKGQSQRVDYRGSVHSEWNPEASSAFESIYVNLG